MYIMLLVSDISKHGFKTFKILSLSLSLLSLSLSLSLLSLSLSLSPVFFFSCPL